MTAKRFTKGDYNLDHCEIWLDDEYIGDVRTKDADIFIGMMNTLTNENEQLKKILNDSVSQLDIEIGDDYSQYWVGVVIDRKMFRKIKEICK